VSLLSRALAVVEDFAPAWGMRRAHARRRAEILNSGYSQHGASRTKKSLVGWQTSTGGPDSDIVDNLETLRERSRDLCMGEGLAVGALRTIRTNEIGAGLKLNAQVDAKFLGLSDEQAMEWESTVEREFATWADSKACDASRRCTFSELQALARFSQLMSGDVFALLPSIERKGERYDLRVQLVEADRVCDPAFPPVDADILGGVEVGEHGEPVAYWIAKDHPGEQSGLLRLVRATDSHARIPAFGPETGRPLVLHLMESDRPGQRRGVPLLAPVIEKLKQLSRYSEAELMAAVVSGFFTAAITTTTPQTPLGQVVPEDERVDSADENSYELGNGLLLGLAPGESMTSVNPARPNSGFDPFVIAVCRQIGAGIGVPYELLVMQFTASYSASRAALLEAWKRFSVGRAWMVSGFCQPIYVAWLEEAIVRGYVKAPGFFADPLTRAAWCGAEWIGPTQGQLDPTKEVEAAAQRVREGFSTRARETRELTGQDFWDQHRARAREEAARVADRLTPPIVPAAGLALTATDQASIVTVDEARASVGQSPQGGEVGNRYVTEHAAKITANAAPDLAEAAKAKQGNAPGASEGSPAPQEAP
jgi:lambda family phage portal protein